MVFISNLCFGGNPWSKTNRLLALQRKLADKQRQLQREELMLKLMKKQQDMLQQQRQHEAMREHSRSRTPQPGQPHHRYAQPPAFDVSRVRDSSASSTHSSNAATPSSFRPPPFFGGGAGGLHSNVPLVPTPVPGAPRTPVVMHEESGPDDWNL